VPVKNRAVLADTNRMAYMETRATASTTRWAGVGHSTADDAWEAGVEAAAAAVERGDPELLVLFSSNRHDRAELLAGVAERAGGAQLIGCSTAGEIAPSGPSEGSVVVLALGGEGYSARTAAASADDGPRSAGTLVAQGAALPSNGSERQELLMLLTDSLVGDQQEIVRGAYGVVGAGVPMVGGCAADDLKMSKTYQFEGTRAMSGSVVGASISSDAPFGIGVRHGWSRVGEAMMVTQSNEGRVLTLDGRPALDTYLDLLDAPAEAREDPEAFTRFALGHPIGLSRRSGPDQIRCIGKADFDERSIGAVAAVPQGGLAWLMEGDVSSAVGAAEEACADAIAQLGGLAPQALVAFDCTGRRRHLEEKGVQAEVDAIRAAAHGAPVAGFYTYGEIARTHGMSGFHNQTVVVLALA